MDARKHSFCLVAVTTEAIVFEAVTIKTLCEGQQVLTRKYVAKKSGPRNSVYGSTAHRDSVFDSSDYRNSVAGINERDIVCLALWLEAVTSSALI